MRHLFISLAALCADECLVAIFVSPHVLSSFFFWTLILLGILMCSTHIKQSKKLSSFRTLSVLFRTDTPRNSAILYRIRYRWSTLQREIFGLSAFEKFETPFLTNSTQCIRSIRMGKPFIAPKTLVPEDLRIVIGSSACQKKYSASLLNVSDELRLTE